MSQLKGIYLTKGHSRFICPYLLTSEVTPARTTPSLCDSCRVCRKEIVTNFTSPVLSRWWKGPLSRFVIGGKTSQIQNVHRSDFSLSSHQHPTVEAFFSHHSSISPCLLLLSARFFVVPNCSIVSHSLSLQPILAVTVINNIQASSSDTVEGKSVHWHGLLQKSTGCCDGVPGLEQYDIAPGQSLTYTFLADQFGTSWWHSHFRAQYSAGAFGPMMCVYVGVLTKFQS